MGGEAGQGGDSQAEVRLTDGAGSGADTAGSVDAAGAGPDAAGAGTDAADPRAERTVGDLRIVIDRDLCVGFGDCIAEAPDAFDLDDEGVAVFKEPERTSRPRLLDACACCPVDAITVYEHGVAIIP